MAAIAYPGAERRPQAPSRPRHLTLVPQPSRVRRPSRATAYRRRRVLVVVALFLAVFFLVLAARAALGVLGGGPLAATGTPAVGAGGAPAAVYVVQPGDTYWTIARHLQPTGDVRGLVDHLSSEHGGAPLQPGEQLALR